MNEMIGAELSETISFDDMSLGMVAKIQRVLQGLNLTDVASMAGVSRREVELFECNRLKPCPGSCRLLSAYNIITDANMVAGARPQRALERVPATA